MLTAVTLAALHALPAAVPQKSGCGVVICSFEIVRPVVEPHPIKVGRGGLYMRHTRPATAATPARQRPAKTAPAPRPVDIPVITSDLGIAWSGDPTPVQTTPAPARAAAQPATPAAPPPPRFTPAQVAARAVSQLRPTMPALRSTPCAEAGCSATVGVPLWLATDAWQPVTSSVTLDGLRIDARAEIESVTWDLGDGRTVVCATAGTIFDPAMGWGESPTCGASGYQTPADAVTQTATATWRVTWTGAETGSSTLTTTASRTYRVGEYQAVITS